MRKTGKKIIFEKIRQIHYFFIKYCLWRGYSISVFDFNYDVDMKKCAWLRQLIMDNRINCIYIRSIAEEHGISIDQTKIVYNNYKNDRTRNIISDLYGTNEVDFVFKKSLIREIFRFIYINSYLNNLEYKGKSSEYTGFIPDRYGIYARILDEYGTYKRKELKNLKIYRAFSVFAYMARVTDRIKYFLGGAGYLSAKIILLAIARMRKRNRTKLEHFEYAIPITQVFQTKFEGSRSFDFLLDNKTITKENTVFILYIPLEKEWVKRNKEKGYKILDADEIYGFRQLLNASCPAGLVSSTAGALFRFLFCGSSLDPFVTAFLQSLNTFIDQELLFEHITFRKYIYSNLESLRQLAVNILIRKHGGETWNYSSFIGGGLLYAKEEDEFSRKRHILWSFLNSDNYLLINRNALEYNKLHAQGIRKYHVIGSIYSEMIRESMDKSDKRGIFENYFGKVLTDGKKIISFFDTSFVNSEYAFTSFDDAIMFYRDIIRLLEEMKELYVIIKPSKDESYFISPYSWWSSSEKGSQIIKLWNALAGHERVHWDGHTGDIPVIMAISDLVVTSCFSSPTAEALGARKKAIWYESSEKHRGLLYDRIPDLCAHGYGELKSLTSKLLYTSDEDYNAYLDSEVLGKVEAYLDGKALTRFRELLIRS